MRLENLKNKKVCVVGLLGNGHKLVRILHNHKIKVSGADTLNEKEKEFVTSQVAATDVHWITSHENEAKILDHDLIITSVGYQKFQSIINKAAVKTIPIISEIDFLADNVYGPKVGITGTHGKSTVVYILRKILEVAKINHQAFGGSEYPFPESFDNKERINIFELSSSKLMETEKFHPQIAVITNLALAHQERHHTLTEYFLTKAKIFAKQTSQDFLVFNGLNNILVEIIKMQNAKARLVPFNYSVPVTEGIFHKGNSLLWKWETEDLQFSIVDFKLLGPHNVENLMAAIAVAKLLKVPDSAISETIPRLSPLPMRLQLIATVHGVKYYNDSRSATPAATSWGLHALKKNVVVLAGGVFPAGAQMQPLAENLKLHCKTLILFGDDRKKFHDALGEVVETYLVETLKEAVNLAYQKAKRGDSVLFSPMALPEPHIHRSPIHRGNEFAHWIEDLKGREKTRQSLQWELNKI